MKINLLAVILSSCLVTACATGINSVQKQELAVYEQKNLAVVEKDPGTGVALGFLPGGGSFYSREYGYGVLNLLLWPISIFWDPISGARGSESINYTATMVRVNKLKSKELDDLDEKLKLSEINVKQYNLDKRKIEEKYSGSL